MIIFILILWFILGLLKGKGFSNFITLSILYFWYCPGNLIYKILFYIIFYFLCMILQLIICKRPCRFDMYFGVPGSGKTTVAAWVSKYSKKRVFSNFSLKGSYKIDKSDIGVYDIDNSTLLLDEIGIDYNNRNFKSNFTKEQLEFFKYHRHHKVDIYCFSQYWDDPDKKLRDLSTRLFYIKKSLIPFFIVRKRIDKKIIIDKQTHQIMDGYNFALFSKRYIFAPSVWKMFNSYEHRELLQKEFELW